MSRRVVYAIWRPIARKCPNCCCVLVLFILALALAFTTCLYRSRGFDIITNDDTIRIPDNILDIRGVFPSDDVELEEEKVVIPVNEEKISAAAVQNADQLPAVSTTRLPAVSTNGTNSNGNNVESISSGSNVKTKKSHAFRKKHVKPNPRHIGLPLAGTNNTDHSENALTRKNMAPLSNRLNLLVPNSVNRTNEEPAENRISTGSIAIKEAEIDMALEDRRDGNSSSPNFDGSSNIEKGKTINESKKNDRYSMENADSLNHDTLIEKRIDSNTNDSVKNQGPMIPLIQLQTIDDDVVNALHQLAPANSDSSVAQPT